MNLFEKIAKKKDNSNTAANVGLGAATIGGLGTGAYYSAKAKEMQPKLEQAQEIYGRYSFNAKKKRDIANQYEKDKMKDAEKDALRELRDEVKESNPNLNDESLKNKFKGKYKDLVNKYVDQTDKHIKSIKRDEHGYQAVASRYKSEIDDINKLGRNAKLGLAAAGLGAAGLGYNLYKSN
jgi:uncharacterized protein YaaR (DUF327 family)